MELAKSRSVRAMLLFASSAYLQDKEKPTRMLHINTNAEDNHHYYSIEQSALVVQQALTRQSRIKIGPSTSPQTKSLLVKT